MPDFSYKRWFNSKLILSKTKKNKPDLAMLAVCPIGLKSFEGEFNKTDITAKSKVSHVRKMKKLAHELLSKFAPNAVKPQNDYYDYINYQWLRNIDLKKQQEYIVQIDDFRLTQDKVYQELNEIILDYIKTHNDKLSKNLKYFYDSVINLNTMNYSRQLAKEKEELINDYMSENSPWKLLAFINSDEMIANGAPFVWTLNPDNKNVKQYRCYLDPHQFAILDSMNNLAVVLNSQKKFEDAYKLFQICLKTHFAKADFAEFGIGYFFR
jgi:hypothetical protein